MLAPPRRLRRPSAGTIEIHGEDITRMEHHRFLAIQKRWGVLFQSGALFSSLRVLDNILLPMEAWLRDNLGLTVVMITHDLDTLFNICDRIAVLVDRRIQVGTLQAMLANPHPWIHRYFHGARARAARGE